MQYQIVRRSARASLGIEPGGVLVIRFSGLVTGPVLAEVKREVVARHGDEVLALVADYTRAAVAYSVADLDQVIDHEAKRKSITARPCAMLVREDDKLQFMAYAERAALRGVFRRVFPPGPAARSAALRWLRETVETFHR